MIISKTPLRISFFGGGSDIPAFYEKERGIVLSVTIDKYITIAVNKCEPDYVRLSYSKQEVVDKASELKHERARHILDAFGIDSHIEIASFSPIISHGTGLGSSSSFTVGLINALDTATSSPTSRKITKYDLAQVACDIEINRCNEPIGKQDQFAAAFGGFNKMSFFADGSVEVTQLPLDIQSLMQLNDRLMLFPTGKTRNAKDILANQVNNIQNNEEAFNSTKRMSLMAEGAFEYLKKNKFDDFGAMLDYGWRLKKSLSNNISSPEIDEMYEEGLKAGALGGKILGAGGGGYMLFYVPQGNWNFYDTMKNKYGRPMNFSFSFEGSTAVRI